METYSSQCIFVANNDFQIQSFTDPSKKYSITHDFCSCPSFKYSNKKCKHIKKFSKYIPRGRDRPNTKKVRSHSNPKIYYKVSTYRNGIKTCTCPHFRYRKSKCKHM